MAMVFDIEQLVLRVNRRLEREGIEVSDGRSAPDVTIRNVRYYQTLGLLPPVLRHEGRAGYSDQHVEAIVNIKRAQAQGRSLADMPRFRTDVLTAASASRPAGAGISREPVAAWIAPINDSVQLIGTGPAPSPQVLDAIAALLAGAAPFATQSATSIITTSEETTS